MFLAKSLGKQRFQKRVLCACEGAHDGDAVPGKAFLKILTQEKSTAGCGGDAEHHRIPDAELMRSRDVRRSDDCRGLRFNQRESVAPAQQGGTRAVAGALGLPNENVE